MAISIREVPAGETDELLPLLLLAEPSARALRWSLDNLSDTVYRMDDDAELIGAATMRWLREPCEIIELGVRIERQGQGFGQQLVAWLIDEARRRAKHELRVGTSNASIGNIVFYQKCGFRMHEIRADYFWYHRTPVFEHGLPVRDMLVFRYDLTADAQEAARPPFQTPPV